MTTRQADRGVVLAIILVGYPLVLIDVSILMAALPRIHRDLGFSPTSLSWAQNAYTLTFGGLLLLGARIGDLAGRRRMFVIGIALFAAASLAVGLAQSPAWIIAARAVQGIGAAILAPSTLALLSTSFAEGPERERAMAAYGALTGIGTAFGLIHWPVRQPYARRGLRRPLPLQRCAREPLLLHDAVPPRGQRLYATQGRAGVPPGYRRGVRKRGRHLASQPARRHRRARRSGMRSDAPRHRLDEPRFRWTHYLTGIALAMIVFGMGRALG